MPEPLLYGIHISIIFICFQRCIGIRQVVDTADEIIAILGGRKSVRDEFLSLNIFFFLVEIENEYYIFRQYGQFMLNT